MSLLRDKTENTSHMTFPVRSKDSSFSRTEECQYCVVSAVISILSELWGKIFLYVYKIFYKIKVI